LGDPVLLRRQPRDSVGILTVVIRHVSSFATAVARWVRVRGAPVSNPATVTAISVSRRRRHAAKVRCSAALVRR
jgi:hypothetical protein